MAVGQFSGTPQGLSVRQLFEYPFRIFFVSLGLWAVVAIPLWLSMLSGVLVPPLALPMLIWHQHEMLFGFLNAAIAGFLLTAVCVWTQTNRLHGYALAGLWAVWLAGRVLLLVGEPLPDWLVHGVNLAFLPLVIVDAGWRVIKVRQQRQYPLLLALTLLWLMQVGLVLQPQGPFAAAGLVAAMTLMLIIGGRITPSFSGGWLKSRGLDADIRTYEGLERATLISMLLLFIAVLLNWSAGIVLMAVCAALASGWRLWLWRGWRVRSEPLLWVLHLSILWIPVALLLLVAVESGAIASTVWRHAAGFGAMGGLILGVITRVSLGHTGRPLVLPSGIVAAYILIQVGALLRVSTGLTVLPWHTGVLISGVCWSAAFALFLWRYLPVLMSPRPDGRPG
jgi:uncharacterized protein involved in response to NO